MVALVLSAVYEHVRLNVAPVPYVSLHCNSDASFVSSPVDEWRNLVTTTVKSIA